MAELREVLEASPFEKVSTYIQSGNIIFRHPAGDQKVLAKKLAKLILAKFGYEVEVIVKQPDDMKDILRNNPFINERNEDTSKMYVTFLFEKPDATNISKIDPLDYSPEECRIMDDHIYFFSPEGYGRAKMNNNFFEKQLKVSATTRNWRTVNKLVEMANAI